MSKFGELIDHKVPVLLNFYTEWSEECESIHPILKDVSAAIGDKAVIIKINADKNENLAEALRIKALPTFEGLKQIIYEPESRVRIGEFIPSTPLRNIDSVKFLFEPGTRIVHQDDDISSSTLFCFGKDYEIHF